MAKNKETKKKTVKIDYGKMNRDRFQNARAVGIILIICSALVLFQGPVAENLKFIPILLAGIACTIYGVVGLQQMKKAQEEYDRMNGDAGR